MPKAGFNGSSGPRQRSRCLRGGILVGLCAVATGTAPAAMAQSSTSLPETRSQPIAQTTENPPVGFSEGSLIFAPIPFKNPLLGNGLALGGAYLFQTDETSKSSNIAAGGMRSSNGSSGYGLSTRLAFGANRWQIKAAIARADLRYDVFTSLGRIPIRQDGVLANLSLNYGFTPDFSVGVTSRYLDTSVGLDTSAIPGLPPELLPDAELTLLTLGLTTEWDKRDNPDYPTDGFRLVATGFSGSGLNDRRRNRSYSKIYSNFDVFRPVGPRGVLTGRVSACVASSDAPFFDRCMLGLNDGFRGFTATQFIDDHSISAQVEFRQRIGGRFGAVAFAGVGSVGPGYGLLNQRGTHSAVGIGARFRLSRKFPVDFSTDLSWNDTGERLLYIYVGQRW